MPSTYSCGINDPIIDFWHLPLHKLVNPILYWSTYLMEVSWLQRAYVLAVSLYPRHIPARWLGCLSSWPTARKAEVDWVTHLCKWGVCLICPRKKPGNRGMEGLEAECCLHIFATWSGEGSTHESVVLGWMDGISIKVSFCLIWDGTSKSSMQVLAG